MAHRAFALVVRAAPGDYAKSERVGDRSTWDAIVPRRKQRMGSSYQFTVDVFRTVCDRLQAKAADLRLLIEAGTSFVEWLTWEAFLACKLRQESYPFCEVAARPTY